jgi:hypothetical protein
MTVELYTTKDIQNVRDKLLNEQGRVDPITNQIIPDKQAVLDHDHKTQYVRAVLHRQTNAVLGKIENLWTRYLGWWYTGTLPEFLRKTADYLEKEHPKEYLHPYWMKRLNIEFNKLTEGNKREVLLNMSQIDGKNAEERKSIFNTALKTRKYKFLDIISLIKQIKEAF